MELGQFSVSLAVKDLQASQSFYEKLGFVADKHDTTQPPYDQYGKNWLILQKDGVVIGLFHGMFEKNILTFNPTDVRTVQKALKAAGATFTREADETTSGPDYATLTDPDGNPILLDQHNP